MKEYSDLVNKNWTPEEALAANKAALEANPSLSKNDPSLPFIQWHALHYLDALEYRYRARGRHKFYVMEALAICVELGLPPPSWTRKPYLEAYGNIIEARSKSWDEVLDSPYPKGTHLNALRKKIMLAPLVISEISSIKKSDPDRAIDDGLFEEVGAKFGIGKTLASNYYYDSGS